MLQTNYSIRLSDKVHITDKCVHKSDSQLPQVTRQPISYFEGRFYISVGVICLIFLLEPVSLQTSRSATPHVQTNCTLCSLGQDSLSLPQSELLSAAFISVLFFETFQSGGRLFWVSALLATTPSQSCSYNGPCLLPLRILVRLSPVLGTFFQLCPGIHTGYLPGGFNWEKSIHGPALILHQLQAGHTMRSSGGGWDN